MAKIVVVVGTRPEAIKMAPVVMRLQAEASAHQVEICSTGQHGKMLDDVFDFFSLSPGIDLEVMKSGQDLNALTWRLLEKFGGYLESSRPDLVVVHGDTTSSFVASLATYYARVPIAHVEAGLRTGDPKQPFPEEFNRRSVAAMADIHFAPTKRARQNLVNEGISGQSIFLVGNTIVDAVTHVEKILSVEEKLLEPPALALEGCSSIVPSRDEFVLITIHRRENHGPPLERITQAVIDLAQGNPHVRFIATVHPNPEISIPLKELLGFQRNVHLVEPLDYLAFSRLLRYARVVLTDSGGVQEEAVSFGTPIIVLREKSERPEGIESGLADLVGSDRRRIVAAASHHLDSRREVGLRTSPYGDGFASKRIVKRIGEFLAERV